MPRCIPYTEGAPGKQIYRPDILTSTSTMKYSPWVTIPPIPIWHSIPSQRLSIIHKFAMAFPCQTAKQYVAIYKRELISIRNDSSGTISIETYRCNNNRGCIFLLIIL